MTKFCILMTANDCGHCRNFRGDGIINSNQSYMHPDFLIKIIAPYKDIRLSLFNINYNSMNNSNLNTIKDITKTYLSDKRDSIVQERFTYDEKNNAYLEVRSFNNNSKKLSLVIAKKDILKNGNQVSWFDFLKDKISPKLENYVYYFPSFALADKDNWKNSFNNGQLLMYLDVGYTIKQKTGEIMYKKNDPNMKNRSENIMQMIDAYVVKNVEMKPHEDLTLSKEPNIQKPEKVEVKKEKEPKKKVKFDNRIIQIQYEDV